jgi:hypothetical protein
MPYGRAYGRSYGHKSLPTGPRANKHDAACSICGQNVPAGTGTLTGNRDKGYTIYHTPSRWVGSPISGRFVGGCPKGDDK